ncbi:MAG: Nif3-like dinuclear metal center hexameric protein [Oscillospiraceae bacterium]|nr:Nif3-like dinuclear metal center hexameric protein [Oscillospiraceae bacterium]
MPQQSYKISEILSAVEEIAPPGLCAEWDNIGLLVGDSDERTHTIGVCLDICDDQLEQAKKLGVGCIISHHPVIYSIKEKRFVSPQMAYKLARDGIAAIAAHTNLDCAENGVNDILARKIGLDNIHKASEDMLAKGENLREIPELLRFGELLETQSPQGFAQHLSRCLNTVVQYADCGKPIRRVAVVGGSAADYLRDCAALGYDAYLTGEAKLFDFYEAKSLGINLFTAGHFETENPVVEFLAQKLRKKLPNTKVFILEQENPVQYAVNSAHSSNSTENLIYKNKESP